MEEDFGEGHGRPLYYPHIQAGESLSHTLVDDGGITVDGILDEANEPDFSVFWKPDSPHPDGYTYGWLHSDGDYLYATIEVTADNTPDEEDWGALYVIVDGEYKEFRISYDDNQWGSNGFQYTSSVLYEHRIYEFQIPLSEIYTSIGNEVQYGFGCYGTVTENECDAFQDTAYGWGHAIDPTRSYGQTFTAHWTYWINSVDLLMTAPNGGTLIATLSIHSLDEYGLPDTPFWTSLEVNTTIDPFGEWVEFYFPSPPIELLACNKYALVLNVSEIRDGTFYLQGSHSNQYPEGERIWDSGLGWWVSDDEDYFFQIWGDCEDPPAVCGEPPPSPEPSPSPGQPSDTVGGDIFTVSKIGLIVPWIALAVIIIAGGIFLYRRRILSMK
jgi:hypothetical protein